MKQPLAKLPWHSQGPRVIDNEGKPLAVIAARDDMSAALRTEIAALMASAPSDVIDLRAELDASLAEVKELIKEFDKVVHEREAWKDDSLKSGELYQEAARELFLAQDRYDEIRYKYETLAPPRDRLLAALQDFLKLFGNSVSPSFTKIRESVAEYKALGLLKDDEVDK